MGRFSLTRADPNAVDSAGNSALHEAVMGLEKYAVSFAVEFNRKSQASTIRSEPKFDLNIPNNLKGQMTPLHMACSIPSLAIIIELVSSPKIDLLALTSSLKLPNDLVPMNYLTSRKAAFNPTRKRLKIELWGPLSRTNGIHEPLRKRLTIRQNSQHLPRAAAFEKPNTEIHEELETSLAEKLRIYSNDIPLRMMLGRKVNPNLVLQRLSTLASTGSEGIGRVCIPSLSLAVRMPMSKTKKRGIEDLLLTVASTDQIFSDLEATSKRIAALSAKGTFSTLFETKTLSNLSKNLRKIELLLRALRNPQLNQYMATESLGACKTQTIKVLIQVENSLVSLISFSSATQINIIDSVRYQLALLESEFGLMFEPGFLKKSKQVRCSHCRLD
jgi:ankyrin repeat protein